MQFIASYIAAVVELADARDSKSRDGDIVWVRPPPAAPFFDEIERFRLFLFFAKREVPPIRPCFRLQALKSGF